MGGAYANAFDRAVIEEKEEKRKTPGPVTQPWTWKLTLMQQSVLITACRGHCGSSDANSRYTDGHTYCFSCENHEPGDDDGLLDRDDGGSGGRMDRRLRSKLSMAQDLIEGEIRPLQKRGISQETCAKFGYMVGKYKGKTVQIAPYRDEDGRLVAQHLRTPSKEFPWLGDAKQAVMFGQHLWKDGGRRVVIFILDW